MPATPRMHDDAFVAPVELSFAEKHQLVQDRYDRALKDGDADDLGKLIHEYDSVWSYRAPLLNGLNRDGEWRKERLLEVAQHELRMAKLELSKEMNNPAL